MSAQFALLAAQAGMDLFQTAMDTSIAKTAARVQGRYERSKIKLASRQQAEDRNDYLVSVLGAQRSALAASGVGGGRTARLLDAQAQRKASRARMYADIQTSDSLIQSRLREKTSVLSAKRAMNRATMDMFASILSGGMDISQQNQAIGGP